MQQRRIQTERLAHSLRFCRSSPLVNTLEVQAMIDSERPIEDNICRFFKIEQSQLRIEGRTMIIECNSQEEFTRLCEFYEEAQFWKGIYHYLALTLNEKILVLPLNLEVKV